MYELVSSNVFLSVLSTALQCCVREMCERARYMERTPLIVAYRSIESLCTLLQNCVCILCVSCACVSLCTHEVWRSHLWHPPSVQLQSDDEARQMLYDLEGAYQAFIAGLKSAAANGPSPAGQPGR
jgi:hypothetical protein